MDRAESESKNMNKRHRVRLRYCLLFCLGLLSVSSYSFAGTINGNSHLVLEGDYNSDGHADLYLKPKILILAANIAIPIQMSLKHIVLQNNGSGSYTVVNSPNMATISSTSWVAGAHTLVGGDFDGDGDDDALLQAVAVADDSYVLMVDGSGNVALEETINALTFGFDIASQAGVSISVTDADADGDDDLVFIRTGYSLSYGYFYSTGSNSGRFGEALDGLTAPVGIASATLAGTGSYSVNVSVEGYSEVGIPISVVSGVNGLQPALAVNYSSGQGRRQSFNRWADEVLGYGWSLDGLSSIKRCEQRSTYVALSFISSDRLCLDGQLLVATSGSYWSSGTIYKTELETFTRVVQNGSVADASFTVHFSDGRVATYGGTEDSQIGVGGNPSAHYVWAVNEERDRYDNEITYRYFEPGDGEYYPLTIDYSGARVAFEYEARSGNYETSVALTSGGLDAHRTVALHTIRTSMNGVPVREYRIDNQEDQVTSGAITYYLMRLHKVQECGYSEYGSSIQCLPALEIFWNDNYVAPYHATAVNKIVDGLGSETLFGYEEVVWENEPPPTHRVGPFFSERPFYNTSTTQSKGAVNEPVLVKSMARSNGRGGSREFRYLYSEEIYKDSGNRGYIGPGAQRVEDVERGTFTYRIRRLEFPYIGLVGEERIYSGTPISANLIEATYYDWSSLSFNSGLTQYPHLREITYERREDGQRTAVRQTESSYQNTYSQALHTQTLVTQSSASFSTGTSATTWGDVPDFAPTGVETTRTTVTTRSSPDTTNWLVNFVTDQDVTYAASGETSRTVAADFVAASGTVRNQVVTQFPGDSDLEVEITNTFDGYGNLTDLSIDSLDVSVSSRDLHFSSYTDLRYPTMLTNPDEHVQTIIYDPRFGTAKQITDANGLVTYISRDVLGRVTEQEGPDGTRVQLEYSDCSGCSSIQGATPRFRLTQSVSHPSSGQQGAPDVFRYLDDLGRVIREEHEGFDGSLIRTDTLFDTIGRVDRAYLPATGTPTKYVDYNYDNRDRVTAEDRPGTVGGSVAIAYNDSSSHAMEIAVTETIEGGAGTSTQIKVSRFNAAGQLAETLDGCTSAACTNSTAIKTEYDYDAFGNLDWTRVDGNAATVTTMVYDDAGNKTSISEPNSGTTSFDYDALGLLRSQTDALSQVTTYTYDLLDRLIVRVDGATTNTWTYDTDYIGALEKVVQTNGGEQFREAYTYDSLVRPLNTTTTIPEHSGSFVFKVLAYDAYSRPVDLEYPSGLEISKVYNSYGYDEETERTGGSSISKVTAADHFGNVTSLALGNGLSTTRGYDADSGRLTSIDTGSIQNNDYIWRSNGALHSRAQGTTTEVFSYDDVNRLTQSLISGVRTLAYQYDDLGNITSKTDTDGDDLTNWSYSGSGPHTVTSVTIGGSGQTYSYDANGNATSARGRTITYNTFNKPTSIDYPAGNAETAFEYGPDRARYRQYAEYTDGGDFYQVETFYVAGGLYEKVITTENYSTTTSTERCYVGGSYLEVDCGGASPVQYYLLRDHLGSIDSITNANGAEVDDMAFDPYGLRREGDWTAPLPLTAANLIADAKSPRGFTHHEHLDRTGFIHMNGRLYDPVIGRFLSADPFVTDPLDSQSFNRFAYVRNTPLSLKDPTGYVHTVLWRDSPPSAGEAFRSNPNAGPVRLARDGVNQGWGGIRNSFAVPPGTALTGPTSDSGPGQREGDRVPRTTRGSDSAVPGVQRGEALAQKGVPISDEERAFAEAGNRKAFWTSRTKRGDAMGQTALDIVNNDGVLTGKAANLFARLGGQVNGADVDLEALGVDLMRAHVRATDLDSHSIPHHLNAEQIQRYHWPVFENHNIPTGAYGGTIFNIPADHWLNAPARAIYCPNCDKPF